MINEVAGRFSEMIDELHNGIADCQAEQDRIKTNIEHLRQRDEVLSSSVDRASTMTDNLRKLVGE